MPAYLRDSLTSPRSPSVVSEARVSKLHTRARCVCALSIQRLEGRRWRLRRMRANGYGNSIFSPTCKLLVLRHLENEHVREPQFDALRGGMTCGALHAKRPPRQRLRSSPVMRNWNVDLEHAADCGQMTGNSSVIPLWKDCRLSWHDR